MVTVKRLAHVSSFISSLNHLDAAACIRYIDLLSEFGWFLKPPYTEHTEGLYILRPSGKGGEFRIFYTFHKREAYLLHAIHKKTMKLDRKDIELAKIRASLLKKGNSQNC